MGKQTYLWLKSKLFKYIFWLIFFGILWIVYEAKRRNAYSCAKYTIVKPTNISGGFSSYMSLEYDVTYQNKKYSGSDGKGLSKSKAVGNPGFYLNRRYFVRFYCEDPNVSEILWDISVPDSLI